MQGNTEMYIISIGLRLFSTPEFKLERPRNKISETDLPDHKSVYVSPSIRKLSDLRAVRVSCLMRRLGAIDG